MNVKLLSLAPFFALAACSSDSTSTGLSDVDEIVCSVKGTRSSSTQVAAWPGVGQRTITVFLEGDSVRTEEEMIFLDEMPKENYEAKCDSARETLALGTYFECSGLETEDGPYKEVTISTSHTAFAGDLTAEDIELSQKKSCKEILAGKF
ncbi:MAG: hypothetical protein MJY98_08370 [Fibrobacter sp.]|nr:hypothetical protein [Fibrobacter sp.]